MLDHLAKPKNLLPRQLLNGPFDFLHRAHGIKLPKPRLDLKNGFRNARHTHLSEDGLTLHQTLIDPDDLNDWSLHLTLDLEKSNEARTPVLHLEAIAPI